jgi:hypothetical protein
MASSANKLLKDVADLNERSKRLSTQAASVLEKLPK